MIAAHNAFSNGQHRRVNHRVIPRTIFTDPQIAVVGMTEEEAQAAGHPGLGRTVTRDMARQLAGFRGHILRGCDEGKTLRTLFCRNFQRLLAEIEVVSAKLSKRRLRMKYGT